MHIKQHTVQKPNRKTETAVNLVKPKPNRKPQFFYKTEPKTEPVSFCQPHTHSYDTEKNTCVRVRVCVADHSGSSQ